MIKNTSVASVASMLRNVVMMIKIIKKIMFYIFKR